MDKLEQKFNAWLAQRFDPERTQSGRIRTRKGVDVYPPEAQQTVRKLLGGAYSMKAVRNLRAGEQVPFRLRSAVERIVELEDPDVIRARVRDEKLVTDLRHGRKIHSISGTGPDGRPLEAWARGQRRSLNETYETDAPLQGEAAELWREIVGVPRVNRKRRQRRAA